MRLAPPPLELNGAGFAESRNHADFKDLLTLLEAQIFMAPSMRLEDWELPDLVDFFRLVKCMHMLFLAPTQRRARRRSLAIEYRMLTPNPT